MAVVLNQIEQNPVREPGSSNLIFPKVELDEARYVKIKVFKGPDKDPNDLIQQAVDTAAGTFIDSFKGSIDVLNTSAKKWTTDLLEKNTLDALGDIGDFATNIAKDIKTAFEKDGATEEIIQSITQSFTSTISTYASNFKDFGNPSLGDKFIDEIWLPLPNELSEMLSHQWNGEGDENASLVNLIPGVQTAFKGVETISGLASKATGSRKLSYYDNRQVMYDKTDYRTITLNWTLIPNNHEESIVLQQIITSLKAYSSPQAVAGKLLLRAPFYFKLEFSNQYLEDMMQFKEVVIQNIEVNYSVTGYMETFIRDNTPKTMSMSITFHDREPKTLEDWVEKD